MHWSYSTDYACLSATVVRARVEQDLAIWTVSGMVTDLMLPQLFVDAFAWHEKARAGAHVLDYSEAVIAASPKAFGAIAQAIVRRRMRIAAPAAIISTPEQLGFFRDYAASMERHGVHREVFLSHREGRAWALAALRAQTALCAAARGGQCNREAQPAEVLQAVEPGIAPAFDRTGRPLSRA
jgi:hypothetical protein